MTAHIYRWRGSPVDRPRRIGTVWVGADVARVDGVERRQPQPERQFGRCSGQGGSIMNTAKLTLYRWRSADGGQAQPDDTVEVEVGVVAWDLDNDAETEAVWIDASLLGEDLGRRSDGSRRTWTVADVMHRFRPNRFAVAYGDLYVDDRERPLIDMDPELTASIEAHGTDCRDPADYLSAQADVT